ncbi:NERD domain-containing protein [Anaerosporobacter sp.]|uniref:NERD domain-containing protein n=1 Tax=Anaerosporobacter sp. TaxID=1872529 RepID=UPI00286F1301|nr:NERD domain-containing protein [Anaerosporobacter sp.]
MGLLNLFNKLKEPIFLKEDSDIVQQLGRLREIEPLLNSEGQDIIRKDIKNLEYGLKGEENIAYELKNSHMPMYILHDIYLDDENLNAQIDYIVITRKLIFVIECKNLYGDIEITNNNDFIRTLDYGKNKKKEGVYSPITQNQRHLELMKKLYIDNKANIFNKTMLSKQFDSKYKSVIVLANPKTILNSRYAPKETKDKVIRADQLIQYIKDMCDKVNISPSTDEELCSQAKFYLELNKSISKDYTKKYNQYILEQIKNDIVPDESDIQNESINDLPLDETEQSKLILSADESSNDELIENSEVYNELKKYRFEKSREEKIKPYFIYNNEQLKNLILQKPRTRQELKKIQGFGDVKINKYGDDILKIIDKY